MFQICVAAVVRNQNGLGYSKYSYQRQIFTVGCVNQQQNMHLTDILKSRSSSLSNLHEQTQTEFSYPNIMILADLPFLHHRKYYAWRTAYLSILDPALNCSFKLLCLQVQEQAPRHKYDINENRCRASECSILSDLKVSVHQ